MSQLYVYASILTAQVSILVGATSLAWSSPMIIKLSSLDDNPLGRKIESVENSLLTSLPILGTCCGAIIYGMLGSKFGRKTLLLSATFIYAIFYLITAFAANIWLMYLGRILIGIGMGGTNTILPIYCGELAEAKNRGVLSTFMAVMINIGLLTCYLLGPYLSFFTFNLILAIIPTIHFPIFYFLAPESPYFLIKYDEAGAKTVLRKLRGEQKISEAMKEIQDEVENSQKQGSIKDIINNKALQKSFIMGIGGITFTIFTGSMIVASYTQTIFEDSAGSIPSDQGPIYTGAAQLITTCIMSIILDKFPRKVLLITSYLGIGLTMIPLGLYFVLSKNGTNVDNISWLPLACMITFVCVYNVGVGPIMFTLLGELFPSNVKNVAVSYLVVYMSGLGFILTFLFKSFDDHIGYLFWFFSLTDFLAIIFVVFCMVETKGKSLAEIQNNLSE